MKTMVLYGSPLKNSHTRVLLNAMLDNLKGEIYEFDCYKMNISPCVDCKFCFRHKGCSIKDDMQSVYECIQTCNAVIIASPMHFGSVSSPVFKLFTRFQTYWSARHIQKIDNKTWLKQPKYGVLLVTAGGGWVNMELLTEGIAEFAFDHMEVEKIGSVYAKHTDAQPVRDNIKALSQAKYYAERLNQLCAVF